MTDRRPLGTGCDRADPSRAGDTELPDVPRALLAAERLEAQAAAAPAATAARPAGRRALGTGTAPAHARAWARVFRTWEAVPR